MSERRYLILDIETVPDWTLVRQVFGLPREATPEQMRESISVRYTKGFLPPAFHIPICIALIDVDFDTCKVANAIVLDNADEKSLLQRFWKIVKHRKVGNELVSAESVLVHFNGRGFDMPVLFYRSLKHRVPIFNWDRKRYSSENSHDICEDLGDFGATSKPSLDVVSKMLGLPGKVDIDGSQVEELYRKGERARIKDYCMEDALATYYIWLTMRLIREQISQEKYDQAFAAASETVKASRAQRELSLTANQEPEPPVAEKPPE
jgi:predicted PolB exonuclease-like 3'-5' exonuclease